MEKHLFRFGGSMALVIPKAWAEKNVPGNKGMVYISENQFGNLLISARVNVRKENETVINSKTKVSFLTKLVDAYHLYGVRKIRIYSADHLTKDQIAGIVNKINRKCSGFEITSQSKNDLVIEDFTDLKEIDVDKILLRLRSLINQELNELSNGQPVAIEEVENLVDRFYRLGVRYLYITQAKDALRYFRVLQLLETIGDQLYTLSSNPKIQKSGIFDELAEQFDKSFSGFQGDDTAIESSEEMKDTFLKKLPSHKLDGASLYILKELSINMSKVANFGLRIDPEITGTL